MSSARLTIVVKGLKKGSDARKIAIYLSHELAEEKPRELVEYINLGHIGSVSFIAHQVRNKVRKDKNYLNRINDIIRTFICGYFNYVRFIR